MTAATITFDEIERDSKEVFSYAYLLSTARYSALCFWRTRRIISGLNRILSFASTVELKTLTQDEVNSLLKWLREIHPLLVDLLTDHHTHVLRNLPFFTSMFQTLETQTEDLGDVVENIELAGSADFNKLVSDCIASLSLHP